MADASLSNLLWKRFQTINQTLCVQHELIHSEVLAWQEKFLAECQHGAECQCKTESIAHPPHEVSLPRPERLTKLTSGSHLNGEFVNMIPPGEIPADPADESSFLHVLPGSSEPAAHHRLVLRDNLFGATHGERPQSPISLASDRIQRQLSNQSSREGAILQQKRPTVINQQKRPTVIKVSAHSGSMASFMPMDQVQETDSRSSTVSMDTGILSFTPHDCFSTSQSSEQKKQLHQKQTSERFDS